jgi:replicative DNA helicase
MSQTYDARESQRQLIACILHDASCLDDVTSTLNVEDFTDDACLTIFNVAKSLYETHKPADRASVGEELLRLGHLENVGGLAHLAELFNLEATAFNARHYAGRVKDASLLRQLAYAGQAIMHNAKDHVDAPDALLEAAEQRIFAIGEKALKNEAVSLRQALTETMQRIDERSQEDADQAVKSGLHYLDQRTCGFHPGELIVIAARPSLGKTALAIAFAANVARDQGLAVFFVSLEQSGHEICERLLAAESRIAGLLIRSGQITEANAGRLTAARDRLLDAPIFIDDANAQTVSRIASQARRLKRRHDIRLMVVDYLQLVTPDDKRASRHEQVGGISRRLKQLARELQVPLVALAQLNRESEVRVGHKPKLSDLRESGSIEADADTVLLLHRQNEYSTDLDIIIAKKRNGPTGDITVRFTRDLMRVEDLDALVAPVAA